MFGKIDLETCLRNALDVAIKLAVRGMEYADFRPLGRISVGVLATNVATANSNVPLRFPFWRFVMRKIYGWSLAAVICLPLVAFGQNVREAAPAAEAQPA